MTKVTQPRCRGSAARLGEGDEAAGAQVAPLDQIVPFGLDSQGFLNEGHQIFPGPQGIPEIGLELPEEAGTEVAVGGEAEPIAVVAEVVAHGGDDPHGPGGSGKPVVGGRAVSLGAGHGLQFIQAPGAEPRPPGRRRNRRR